MTELNSFLCNLTSGFVLFASIPDSLHSLILPCVTSTFSSHMEFEDERILWFNILHCFGETLSKFKGATRFLLKIIETISEPSRTHLVLEKKINDQHLKQKLQSNVYSHRQQEASLTHKIPPLPPFVILGLS